MDETRLALLHKRVIEEVDYEAISELINYYDSIEDYNNLEKLYKLALEFNSKDTKALNNLAVIYSDYFHEYEKARFYYEQLLFLEPKNAQVYFNYATILEFNYKEYENAKKNYYKAIELDNHFVDAYLHLSWLFIDKLNDYTSAYTIVNEGLKYINDSDLLAHKGYIEYSKFKEYDKALDDLNRAIELNPNNGLAYTYLGHFYMLRNDYDHARKEFNNAIESGHLNELLIYEYVKLLIVNFKDIEEAISVIKKATDYFDDKVLYYCYLANLYIILGYITDAKQYIKLAEACGSHTQEALLMIGYLKIMIEDDKEEAILYFEKVVEMNPNNINALSIVGFYYLLNNNQIDTALSYFEKIAQISKDNFMANFVIAQMYEQFYEDYHKAIEYYEKINKNQLSEDDLVQLYFIIGKIYLNNLNDTKLALENFEKAYEIKPNKTIEGIISDLYSKDVTLVN